MPIDTVFLDAGGVLIFPNWHRVADALVRHGVKVDAGALAAAEAATKREMDVPAMEKATNDRERGWYYFDLILTRLKIPLSEHTRAALEELDRYHKQWNLWEHVPRDVGPALARLRALGLKLVVVSNSNGTVEQVLTRVGLASKVDAVVDSATEGVEKPDPRLFRIALDRAGRTSDRTLHVGDLYHVDVVGARRAGLRAVLLDPGNLYADADCPRVASLDALADGLAAGGFV